MTTQRDPSATVKMTVVGYVMDDLRISQTPSGTNCLNMMVTGEGSFNYSIQIFDQATIDFVQKNARKNTLVNIVGDVVGYSKAKDNYKALINVRASVVNMLADFGEERSSEGTWGSKNTQQPQQAQPQPQQEQPQQQMENNTGHMPMDFDDDIPF